MRINLSKLLKLSLEYLTRKLLASDSLVSMRTCRAGVGIFQMQLGYLKTLKKVKIEVTAYQHWQQGEGYINSICFKNLTLVFDSCLAEESTEGSTTWSKQSS